jgi:ferritin-like metal-binding protein YciE
MPDRAISEQLVKYLTDVHSIEEQALVQMKAAPKILDDPSLAEIFEEHLTETAEQERLVRERLEALEADPSRLKDLAARAGGWGMVAFAKLNPDTPGKLFAHAYSYEHMELAAYELLGRIAARAEDEATVELARRIAPQEQAMAERIAERWDRAVDASLRLKDAEAPKQELVKYLRDAHAIEAQALQLLGDGEKIAEFEPLAAAFREHHAQTREQQKLIDERLEAHDSGPSRFQAAALRLGGLNAGTFFKAQPDTPAKLAGFAFAFEHIEIGSYELLRRMADRAGDAMTVQVTERILTEERAMAERIRSLWDGAVDAGLRAVGAGTG